MGAETAGVVARLGITPAVRMSVFGPIPIRRILVTTLALVLVAATGFFLLAAWRSRASAEPSVPARAVDRLDLVASVLAYEIQLAAGTAVPNAEHMEQVRQRLPALALADQRTAYVADWHGHVRGATSERPPRSLSDLFENEDIAQIGLSGSVGRTRLRDGTPVLVAVRTLPAGHVAVIQPYSTAQADDHLLYVREAAPVACLLALAGLGVGCARHRRNARIDRQRRTRTSRIDTSLTHGRCGVWDWDTTKNRVFWSASMYQLLGYEPRGEHLSAGEVIALLHPEDGGMRELVSSLSAEEAGALDREIRVRTAQGDWLWLRIKGEAIREPADGTRHVVGLAVDVTAEREAAERRARDDLRLREAVEALTEAFVLWDADDRLIVCNSKYLALHGIATDLALPGTPAREIMAAAAPPLVHRSLDAPGMETDDTRRAETQTADGRWFHVSEHRTRDGGVVSVGTDVSELKRKEARLQAREQHLQGSVRAAETAAQCYALAAERNYEANQAKTEFLARVSHELRTPLNAIIGFSDVMRQQLLGPLDDRYAGYTTGIHASGVKLLEIIDGILQMSRIEKGQFDFAPEILSLGEVVRDVIETVSADIDAKNVTIEADIDEPFVLQADPCAIREILLQLVRNAVKFSLCEGHVRVRVRSALGRLNVFVEDSGIGIPPEVLPELGRPFAQVEAEYNRSCGGAGLGLAIAHSLLEMHGGRLSLKSQPGIGTIALVSLPKVQPAANDAEKPAFQAIHRLVAAE
jgi:two-component system cell cycle sensor histidine kinase PleC